MSAPEGVLIVDKPAGWTSHDVVARIRRLAGTRRVGHAGTLDPMATGVLVLGVGRGTKLLTFLVGCDKGYAATVRLGASTVTDDAEGEVVSSTSAGHLTRADIEAAVVPLTGAISQVPSAVSAIKVDGRRAYARVRAGEDVQLPARPVCVERFVVVDVRPVRPTDGVGGGHDVPDLSDAVDVDIEVDVSSGTYVRALARDLGAALGVGGHLVALRRTRVGSFGVREAQGLDDLATTSAARTVAGEGGIPLLTLAEAARRTLPTREVTQEEARALGYGQPLASSGPRTEAVAAFTPEGRLLAILDQTHARARTRVVFPAEGS